MSENQKPLSEQVAEKMAGLLNEDRSIFTKAIREDGTSQFNTPINARTKQPYRGAAALVLMMQNRRDPRWLTYDQAKFNRTPVKRGAYGVDIEFNSTRELRQKTENGQPVVKENGAPKMERVKLDEPVAVTARMFNGKDLMNLKSGEVKPHEKTPMERAQVIIDNSQIKIEPAGLMTTYDREKDAIQISSMEDFDRPELYYAAALREVAAATSHETRLNRPETDLPQSDQIVRESLRTNIAAVFMSAQLNLPYELGEHANMTKDWAKLIAEEPGELFNAANDAQKIADYVMLYERQPAQKQEVSQDQKQNQSQSGKLEVGLEIPYNNTTYRIIEKQSKNAVKIEDLTSHQKIRITPSMGLYKSLLKELNSPGSAETLDLKQDQQQGEKREEQTKQEGNKEGQQQENEPVVAQDIEHNAGNRFKR
ncbi:zincin-like metallopeptidase domain-containing protein [Mucilaginibacter sp. P25]|uniref:Antirestriction protein ArdC n=1 Tax=Mucilaginibacter gossypiicola TaxID=551995 RepID=A0A1H8AWP1_9SPHI|nr:MULTISPECIES: zincin-like metallopeptidase domain-containing protein [Mucilaginibacter]UOE52219.1 zincin-like metallopeptidase domain-containing protein [Mucilaginibacter sp. SMC90]SEM75172.1 Antirestriction protein ArdC [Mucilaginibacter gossypiicola]